MSRWTFDDSTGIWHLRLAKGFTEAQVRPWGNRAGYYICANHWRAGTKTYDTVGEGKAAVEKYLKRKLKDALTEMEDGDE